MTGYVYTSPIPAEIMDDYVNRRPGGVIYRIRLHRFPNPEGSAFGPSTLCHPPFCRECQRERDAADLRLPYRARLVDFTPGEGVRRYRIEPLCPETQAWASAMLRDAKANFGRIRTFEHNGGHFLGMLSALAVDAGGFGMELAFNTDQ